jgi:sugar lactone lactonase YvrE
MNAFPDPECIWDLKMQLGEGPVWSDAEQALYFVDILGRQVHRLVPGTGARSSWPAPARVSFIVPVAGGGFLCGLEDGLRRFDPVAGQFGPLHGIEPLLASNRLNDGYVDAGGRLWFGTMHDPEEDATGSLYRLAGLPDHPEPVLVDTGYTVSNGPAIDAKRGRLYHNDSARRLIFVFDWDEDGLLSNKRVFAELEQGYPDGIAIDADGTLWVALFDGGGVQRFRPDGSPDGFVAFPCRHVTKIAFGDADGRTAYATTARKNQTASVLDRQPLSGGLFRFRVEVPGMPQHLFRTAYPEAMPGSATPD